MSTMPVVWCSDPNSSSKKPTAFALQGIQLQGNLSEKHVLAVRELINAASEGRLLLPSEGGIVLLDCGVGVGSVIIQDNNSALADSNENHDELETILHQKKFYCNETDHDNSATAATNELASDFQKYEILYEFLCCARCISDGTKGCNRSSRSVEKYLDAKMSSGCLSKRAGNLSRLINARRKNAVSFKSEKRPLKRNQVSASKVPIYATVNKQLKRKNLKQQLHIDQTKSNDLIQNSLDDVYEPNNMSSTVNAAGRKTSFDSTCTVSSMDSGFMEMQNKLEIAKSAAKNLKTDNVIQIKIDVSEEAVIAESDASPVKGWNRLSIPSQSRNRRKSYEEFKSLFCDHQRPPVATLNPRIDAKDSIKLRRKSYEEFKSVTSILCDNDSTINSNSNSNTISSDVVNRNNSELADETYNNFFSKMKRKNSKRAPMRKPKLNNQTANATIDENEQSPEGLKTIYDILRKNSISNVTEANKTKGNYDKNLELFKNHCSKNNIQCFDKMLSCGTIYDIIQRKSDIYTKNFKRYDKYMTYGTLYEISHRKSDEGEQFERKRNQSEKFSKRRINYAHIDFASPTEKLNAADIVTTSTDTTDNNLNSTGEATSASSMKQGNNSANNQLSITSLGSQQLSTIYDILQTKKTDTGSVNPAGSFGGRNRFLVRKITEEDLLEHSKENVERSVAPKPAQDIQQKKPARVRRFSNILSYAPKASNDTDKIPVNIELDKTRNANLEAKIDELYSRLNQISQQQDNPQPTPKSESDNAQNKIYKCNSLDMLLALNENKAVNIQRKPFRKISVPANQAIKILPRKSTRRLSEFTRGEFLNEKS